MKYVPLRYTAEAKYQDSKLWFVDQLLFVDMAIAILATSFDSPSLLSRALTAPFFVLSFMCIYEIGYFENDMKAALAETKPVIADDVQRFATYGIQPGAWLWSSLFAALGLYLSYRLNSQSEHSVIRDATIWAISLSGTRFVFFIYNRQAVQNRSYLYTTLQLFKYCSVPLIFSPTPIGALLIASQVLAMSVVYWVYRAGGANKRINREVMRLAIAVVIIFPCLLAGYDFRLAEISSVLSIAWLSLRLAKPLIMDRLRR